MGCFQGHSDTKVLYTWTKQNSVRRRRACTVCGHRFYTLETIDPAGMSTDAALKRAEDTKRRANRP